MRARYAVALTILGAYFVASYFILHGAIADQRSMQRAIAVSGQQRMYSQRIAMFADAIVTRSSGPARVQAERDLSTSIRIFGEAHRALTTGDPTINPHGWPPPAVRERFFERPYAVDLQVRAYLAHARALRERASAHAIRTDDADLTYLLSVGPGTFLHSLDDVVAAYNVEQRAGVAKFERLQIGLLVIGLSTLVLIWFTILLPMEREIAERTAAMEFSSTRDSLTGAFNRKAFAKGTEDAMRASAAGTTGAMLMIDIDNFKSINDTLGHGIGDDTIVRIASVVRANARSKDIVGRFGGDEFAIFAPSFEDDASLHAFVARMCDAMQFDIATPDGERHRVTASIGVARFPSDGRTLPSLLLAADEALYASKRSGRARHGFYRDVARAHDGRNVRSASA